MATIAKGPGQQEVTGDLHDGRQSEKPGTYQDPQSGKELTVVMSAGADALVRMGWKLVKEL